MTTNQVLDGIQALAGLVAMLPSPLAKYVGEGLELTAAAVRFAERKPGADPAELLEQLRQKLEGEIASEWQAALDLGAGRGRD